jgi:hypothetical protein
VSDIERVHEHRDIRHERGLGTVIEMKAFTLARADPAAPKLLGVAGF